ncbi:DUF3472 domain-containing protein [Burkholderia gladioli]|uniref:DUF3472 domain-containing protein n=1 Tax=Burkholderia gladioli TaxID=28095 RepID=UPI002FDFA3A7
MQQVDRVSKSCHSIPSVDRHAESCGRASCRPLSLKRSGRLLPGGMMSIAKSAGVAACATFCMQFAMAVTPGHIFNAYVPDTSNPNFEITDIVFPITVLNDIAKTGYYFAQDYGFKGSDGEAYTGLQPHTDGTADVRFSNFSGAAKVVDTTHCGSGADNGPGVTCGTKIPYKANVTYNFHVYRDTVDKTVWIGTVEDTSTHTVYPIGSYRVPESYGGIVHTHDSSNLLGRSFVEYYLGLENCAALPTAEVVFGAPVAANGDRIVNGTPWYTSSACPSSDYVYSSDVNQRGDLHIKIEAAH